MSDNISRVDDAAKNAISHVNRKEQIVTAILYVSALIAGAGLGYMDNADVNAVCDFIATVFTRLFKFITVPVIAVCLIATLAKLSKKSKGGALFFRTISYTLITTVLAAITGTVLYVCVSPANVPADMGAGAAEAVEKFGTQSYLQHFVEVIPNNILQPFVAGNVLSILLVAAAFGLGIASMKDGEPKKSLLNFVIGAQELLFVLIHWLIKILPIGILAFTAQLVHELSVGVIIGGIAAYFGVVIGSNLIQMFVVLPLILLIKGLNPLKVARGMLPALGVALFSKSSAATLPVTIASAEDNLKVNPKVSRFVLPICTTINMNGCAAFILITSLFLLQNAGVDLGFGTYVAWVLIATFAAVGNAGVPMGCYFLTLSLVSSMNIPVALMGVILPVYAVIDMIETCLNVWSDSCVANIVNKDMQGKLESEDASS